MKHLKRYSENKEYDLRQEIEELYNDYCSFLVDRGFRISVSFHNENSNVMPSLVRIVINHSKMVYCTVEDVIYDISQFQSLLMSKYKIHYMRMYRSESESKIPEMYKVDEDDLFDESFIDQIKYFYFSEFIFVIKVNT